MAVTKNRLDHVPFLTRLVDGFLDGCSLCVKQGDQLFKPFVAQPERTEALRGAWRGPKTGPNTGDRHGHEYSSA